MMITTSRMALITFSVTCVADRDIHPHGIVKCSYNKGYPKKNEEAHENPKDYSGGDSECTGFRGILCHEITIYSQYI